MTERTIIPATGPEFTSQLAGLSRLAKSRRKVITGLAWRDGHLSATMDDPHKPDPVEEAPASSRGIRQGSLL